MRKKKKKKKKTYYNLSKINIFSKFCYWKKKKASKIKNFIENQDYYLSISKNDQS